MSQQVVGRLLVSFHKLIMALATWSSCRRAQASFSFFGKDVTWHSTIQWKSPSLIHVGPRCSFGGYVILEADSTDTGDLCIFFESDVCIGERTRIRTFGGTVYVGRGTCIGEGCRITVRGGSIRIGNEVTIGHNTEIIVEDGNVVLADEVSIDSRCLLRANGRIDGEGDLHRGLIELGSHTRIGLDSILEANGGYIKSEDQVVIDYRNLIGGKGGVYFESRAHLRHENYVDAFLNEIRFGEHATVGQKCIFAGRGAIRVGPKSLIGGHTFMVSEDHRAERIDIPYRYQGHNYQGIILEENVWIGGKTLILDGVTIGTGSLVGGGAVVTKDLEPWSFAVGVPARRRYDMRYKGKAQNKSNSRSEQGHSTIATRETG